MVVWLRSRPRSYLLVLAAFVLTLTALVLPELLFTTASATELIPMPAATIDPGCPVHHGLR